MTTPTTPTLTVEAAYESYTAHHEWHELDAVVRAASIDPRYVDDFGRVIHWAIIERRNGWPDDETWPGPPSGRHVIPKKTKPYVVQADTFEQLIRLEARVHRAGNGQYVTNCPLGTHRDSNPSFTIYPDQSWFCFGCQESGDADNLKRFRETGSLRR